MKQDSIVQLMIAGGPPGKGPGSGNYQHQVHRASAQNALKQEWEKRYPDDEKGYLPFEYSKHPDAQATEYHAVRQNGKIVAGAHVAKKANGVALIAMIHSHAPGAGQMIMDKVKERNKIVEAAPISQAAQAMNARNGFQKHHIDNEGHDVHTWFRKDVTAKERAEYDAANQNANKSSDKSSRFRYRR